MWPSRKRSLFPRSWPYAGLMIILCVLNSSIPLATVSQPLVEMGRLGLEMLYQISHGKAKLPVKEVLLAKLIKAESWENLSNSHSRESGNP